MSHPNTCPAHDRIEQELMGIHNEINEINKAVLPAIERLKVTVAAILAVALFVGAIIQGVSIAWFSSRINRIVPAPAAQSQSVSMQQASTK